MLVGPTCKPNDVSTGFSGGWYWSNLLQPASNFETGRACLGLVPRPPSLLVTTTWLIKI